MPRGFRPRLRAAALLIAVAAGLLVLGKLLSVKGFAWASEFASIAGFFVALVALIWPWLVHQMSGPRPVSMSRIAEAAEELARSEEHTSELQSPCNLVCRLLLEK